MSAATNVLFVIAVAISGGAVYNYVRLKRQIGSWRRTVGTVVSITKELHHDEDGHRYMHAPVIRFRVGGSGDEATFQDEIWTGGPSHTIGQRVPILYDPANPTSATLAGWRPYFVTMILGTIGGVSLLASLLGS